MRLWLHYTEISIPIWGWNTLCPGVCIPISSLLRKADSRPAVLPEHIVCEISAEAAGLAWAAGFNISTRVWIGRLCSAFTVAILCLWQNCWCGVNTSPLVLKCQANDSSFSGSDRQPCIPAQVASAGCAPPEVGSSWPEWLVVVQQSTAAQHRHRALVTNEYCKHFSWPDPSSSDEPLALR